MNEILMKKLLKSVVSVDSINISLNLFDILTAYNLSVLGLKLLKSRNLSSNEIYIMKQRIEELKNKLIFVLKQAGFENEDLELLDFGDLKNLN